MVANAHGITFEFHGIAGVRDLFRDCFINKPRTIFGVIEAVYESTEPFRTEKAERPLRCGFHEEANGQSLNALRCPVCMYGVRFYTPDLFRVIDHIKLGERPAEVRHDMVFEMANWFFEKPVTELGGSVVRYHARGLSWPDIGECLGGVDWVVVEFARDELARLALYFYPVFFDEPFDEAVKVWVFGKEAVRAVIRAERESVWLRKQIGLCEAAHAVGFLIERKILSGVRKFHCCGEPRGAGAQNTRLFHALIVLALWNKKKTSLVGTLFLVIGILLAFYLNTHVLRGAFDHAAGRGDVVDVQVRQLPFRDGVYVRAGYFTDNLLRSFGGALLDAGIFL